MLSEKRLQVIRDEAREDWGEKTDPDIIRWWRKAARDLLAEHDRLTAEVVELRKTQIGHTDECLEYAAQTGRAFCIASCADRQHEGGQRILDDAFGR